ncbi:MAG: extracellular solute-binding protein, partial [Rhodobacteraceae bacterium]|nr:extracellular solute-binding protein [Paracoccaceae bacterium]
TLPTGGGHDTSAATLGGWNVAVSKYSENQEAAISLAKYLAGPEAQKTRTLVASNLPTIISLYEDADVAREQPIIPRWKDVFLQAVPRPSAPTKVKYNEVSAKFWSAVHNTLSGDGTAAENLELLEFELEELKGSGW